MKHRVATLFLAFLAVLAAASPAPACTLWAAVGGSAGGGALIAKNRDWAPDHVQELRLVAPEQGHKYFGLFALGGKKPRLTAGINDAGLAICSASAGSIPKGERGENTIAGLMGKILSGCGNVAAVLARKELFARHSAVFYLVADARQAARIEVGPSGEVAAAAISQGVLAQTNHYLAPSLAWANKKIGASSQARYGRICELADGGRGPFSFEDFLAMSRDHADGPDNSIWRSGGTPTATRSLAAWIARLPATGAPTLYVRLANPGESEREATLVLDTAFWNGPTGRAFDSWSVVSAKPESDTLNR
jgi:isopenicillin-N N-acyltransferase like protein